MNDLFIAIEKQLESKVPIIAVDGRCAAGKTTLAKMIAEKYGFGLVHMDDFFLPFELRTTERFEEPGGNVHRERFIEEVVPNLGKAFDYRVFCCTDGTMNDVRSVSAGGVVVEGSYSMHPAFGDIYDLTVFIDISPELQQKRIIMRDGEEWWPSFRDKWIPMEEKYHISTNIRKRCDILLSAE